MPYSSPRVQKEQQNNHSSKQQYSQVASLSASGVKAWDFRAEASHICISADTEPEDYGEYFLPCGFSFLSKFKKFFLLC